MTDKPNTGDTLSDMDVEVIKAMAEFNTDIVNVLTKNNLPFQMIVQSLITHAATICIYNNVSRAQMMEFVRFIFTQIQALNKEGVVKDEPKIVLASK